MKLFDTLNNGEEEFTGSKEEKQEEQECGYEEHKEGGIPINFEVRWSTFSIGFFIFITKDFLSLGVDKKKKG